jgi:uracil-DNA glycosylase
MGFLQKDVHPSWNEFFTNEIKRELKNIENSVSEYYPLEENVLRFTETDLANIKYVIVGMEPYCTEYIKNGQTIPEATGRSFEVGSLLDKKWDAKFKQSSLRNIIKTIYYNETGELISMEQLREKINDNSFKISQPKEWFDSMEKQGVLFLNATLTVQPHKVDSHTKLWTEFMNKLILFIAEEQSPQWLLWGNKATDRVEPLIDKEMIIKCSHPRVNNFCLENCFQYADKVNWLGE